MTTIMTRLISSLALIVATWIATTAAQPAIVSRIEHGGNITVNAPAGLAERDNSALQQKEKSERDKAERDKADDKTDGDKSSGSREERQTGRATTHQTVQSRGMGFRIQVCTASSKQEAQQRARQLAAKFPHYRTYVTFKSPTWRLRVGDFKNHNNAQEALRNVRAAFPAFAQQMTLVRDKINNWTND